MVEVQLNARLSGPAMEQKQAGKGRRVQKCQPAEVEVQVDQIDLPREQLRCRLDDLIGSLVVEVAGDSHAGRPSSLGNCHGKVHVINWGSVAEHFLSARADVAAANKRRLRGKSCVCLPKRSSAGNNVAGGTPPAARMSAVLGLKP